MKKQKMVDVPRIDYFMTPWLPLKALPLTCYRHTDAHNNGPPVYTCLLPCALKTCQVVP